MNEGEIRQQAQMLAIQAEISAQLVNVEGFKAENTYRVECGNSIAYGEDVFFEAANDIMKLRDRLLAEI